MRRFSKGDTSSSFHSCFIESLLAIIKNFLLRALLSVYLGLHMSVLGGVMFIPYILLFLFMIGAFPGAQKCWCYLDVVIILVMIYAGSLVV